MKREANVIGPNVAKFRCQRGWTQEQLVAKLQLEGCYITRDILANIESRRSPSNDIQIVFFAYVLGVKIEQLFPINPFGQFKQKGRIVGIAAEFVTRRRADGSPPDS